MTNRTFFSTSSIVLGGLLLLSSCNQHAEEKHSSELKPDADNAGLMLPAGFGALKAADEIGPARHLAVTPEGNIYVKLAYPDKEVKWNYFFESK